MKHTIHKVVAVTLLAAAGASLAQQAPKPEQLIKWRQSAFQVAAWSTGRIKASLDGQYSKDEVQRAANTLAAIANGGLGGLFAPDTEQGKGWHDTSAKPELFKDSARFAQLGADFGKETTELARLAGGGDVAALKTQLAKVQKTCKSCHDDFKAKD